METTENIKIDELYKADISNDICYILISVYGTPFHNEEHFYQGVKLASTKFSKVIILLADHLDRFNKIAFDKCAVSNAIIKSEENGNKIYEQFIANLKKFDLHNSDGTEIEIKRWKEILNQYYLEKINSIKEIIQINEELSFQLTQLATNFCIHRRAGNTSITKNARRFNCIKEYIIEEIPFWIGYSNQLPYNIFYPRYQNANSTNDLVILSQKFNNDIKTKIFEISF